MKNIFDREDLPSSIKTRLLDFRVKPNTKKFLSLFEIKYPLTIDEIIIGLFRKYGMRKSRAWVTTQIYNLKERGILVKFKTKPPSYSITEKYKGVYK